MNANTMIDTILAEGGFDSANSSTSRVVVLGWLNQVYADAVAEAKWRKLSVELGPTVAGTSQYLIPVTAVDIASVQVAGSRPWKRITTEEMWNLRAGSALLRGAAGAFAPNYETDADAVIELYPTPTLSGSSINALVAQLPADLTDTAVAPQIPTDFHRALIQGAIAEGRTIVDERPDLAAPFRQSYDKMVAKLKVRGRSRAGSGAWQAKVAGVS